MMDAEDQRAIDQARARVAGSGYADALDQYRLRAAARHERREHREATATDVEYMQEQHEQLQRTVLDVIDSALMPGLLDVTEDIGRSTSTLQKRIAELEARMPGAEVLATRREISELGSFLSTLAMQMTQALTRMRGELDGMRGDRRDDENVVVPRNAWRHKGAA
jgi:hypothetical protein